jgi:hypothetical protein
VSSTNVAVLARHHVASSQLSRLGSGISTEGSAGASLHVNLANSLISTSTAALAHGHGQAILVNNVISNNANSLVDCSGGGATVTSLGYGGSNGSNAIYLNSDTVLPVGCTAWITPTQFTGK